MSTSGEPEFELTGGILCLDFANTSRWQPPARDEVPNYDRLVAWALAAGSLTPAVAGRVRQEAEHRPRVAARVLERALSLRRAIYATFSAVAAGRKPQGEDVEAIGAAAAKAGTKFRIRPHGERYVWEAVTSDEEIDLDRPLWEIARSAARLLTSEELPAVRECALESCNWLFLDRSRNGKRRWCDMRICGNRSKARRHYARVRRGAA
jgi:predicted RNA-binding Zn ribbon-like protein